MEQAVPAGSLQTYRSVQQSLVVRAGAKGFTLGRTPMVHSVVEWVGVPRCCSSDLQG